MPFSFIQRNTGLFCAVSAFTVAASFQPQPSHAGAYIMESWPPITHEFGLCVSDKQNNSKNKKEPTIRLSRAQGLDDQWYITVFEADVPRNAHSILQEDTSHSIQGVQLFNIVVPADQDDLQRTTMKRFFPIIKEDSYLGLFSIKREGQDTPLETISCHIPQLKL